MAKVKTQFTADDVYAYIDDLDNDQKKKDSLALIELMEEATGEPAKMFGPSIIHLGKLPSPSMYLLAARSINISWKVSVNSKWEKPVSTSKSWMI